MKIVRDFVAGFIVANLFLMGMVVRADTVVLLNDDSLKGKVIGEDEILVVFEHASLGQMEIARDKIKKLVIGSHEVVVTKPVNKQSSGKNPTDKNLTVNKPQDRGLLNTGWLTNWKRALAIGISGSTGTSENLKANLDFTADYEDAERRWSHKSQYYRSESAGILADHSFSSSLSHDWLFPESRYFYFAGGRLDIDEFKDWDERIGLNGGVGYQFFSDEQFRLLGRMGLNVTQTLGGIREEMDLEMLLSAELGYKINRFQSLSFKNTLYPNLSDTGEFRNLSSLDWLLNLEESQKLGVKISLSNEYDSLSSSSNNDFKYTFSLSLGL